MKWVVHGVRTDIISTEVEAEDELEAIEKAGSGHAEDIDVWDSDFNWINAFPG